MRINVANVLTISDYSKEFERWCRNVLVVANPEYAKKVQMGFWVGNTPKTLSLYEKDGDNLILPFGMLKNIPVPNDTEYFSDFPCAVSVDFKGQDVPLYDYQTKAVKSVFDSKYGILQSPAGSGKTQMGVALIKKFGRRALWLTHTADLLNQSKKRAETYIDKDLIGTITEGKVNVGKGVTFATIQTMCKLDMDKYSDLWDVVIVDECHRCTGSPTAVTQFYKVLNRLRARHKIGLSATVHRADGMIKATYALLGQIVHTVSDDEVKDKIMRVGIQPIETDTKMSMEALNPDGTINYAKLITYLTTDDDRNDVIIDALMMNEGESCLILSDRLKHLATLMNSLPDEIRKDAVMVSGKMTSKTGKAQREQAIEDMRNGTKKYLFATYSLAKEGLDIPRLNRLFLTTPQKDYAVITQSIGRIARTFDGKSDAIAYDFIDDIGYLVRSYKRRCTTYRKNKCYFLHTWRSENENCNV